MIPEYLQNYAVLAAVLLAFSASNTLTHESGLLAVTIMGIALGNMRGVHIDDILDFKENLTTVLVSVLFILLAARLPWPLPSGMLLARHRPVRDRAAGGAAVDAWRSPASAAR